MQPPSKKVHISVFGFYSSLNILSFVSLRSFKRGALPIEVSLYNKCILPEKSGLSEEVVFQWRGLSKDGLLYLEISQF